MVEPISPKTIVPRSLETSKLEQNRKVRPEVLHTQVVNELQKKDVKREQQVNKSEKSEHKKVDDEEEKRNPTGDADQKDEKEEYEESKEKEKNRVRGSYIDIKV